MDSKYLLFLKLDFTGPNDFFLRVYSLVFSDKHKT